MCTLVGKTELAQTNGPTIVATLPSGILANDLIIVTLQTGNASGSSAESGTAEYTEFGTQTSNDSQRLALFRKTASGSDVSRYFTVPGGSNASGIVTVWRDVDVSGDPIRDITRSDYATYAAWTVNSGTVSANDGDLLVFANVQDGAGLTRYDSSRVMYVGRLPTTNSNGSLVMGMRQITATGTTSAETVYTTLTSEGGTGYVFALKQKSGGARLSAVDDGTTMISFHGVFADASSTSQMKWSTAAGNVYAPNDIISSGTLDGIAISSTAAAVTIALVGQPNSLFGTTTSVSPTDNSAGIWGGAVWRLPAEVDMSGKIYRVHYRVDYTASRVGVDGVAVVFADYAGAWAAYQLTNALGLTSISETVAEIALGHATLLGSSGTMDWTRIAKRGFLEHRIGSSATATAMYVKDEMLCGTVVATGGGASAPHNMTKIAEALVAWGYYKLADLLGTSLVMPKYPIQIGDGSRPTYWDSAAGSYEYPTAIGRVSGSQQYWNVDANRVGLTFKPSASDTINHQAGADITTTEQDWSISAAGSIPAASTFAGRTLVGFKFADNLGLSWSSLTLKRCPKATFGGTTTRTIAGLSVSDTTATDAPVSVTGDGATISSSSISCVTSTGGATSYNLELGTAVTAITLADVTFSGTPATDKVHVLKTSGTVTITISGTTTLAAGDVTSEGATVVIAAPEIYQVVNITNLVVGSRVQIYDTTNSVELANEIAASSTVTWTDATPYAADRDIRVRIAYVSGVTAKQFIESAIGTVGDGSPNSEVLTYRANQEDDAEYIANGENGSTIYGAGEIVFVDSSPDRIEMNMGSGTLSLQKQYAAWCYYAFTSTGIATDIDYINAIDTANYEFSNIQWKNTSSPTAPLKITGGYARDSTTLDPMDLIDDTGGTIFLAPAHVVATVVNVSGGSTITGDIATVLAAIPSATDNATAVWNKTLP